MFKRIITYIILGSVATIATGQTESKIQNLERFNNPSYSVSPDQIDVNGYFRFVGYNRNEHELFGDSTPYSVFKANDEFTSPTANIDLSFNTGKNSYIRTNLFLFSPFEGAGNSPYEFWLNRKGVGLGGGTRTKYGNIDVQMGGTNFVRFSELTLSSGRQTRVSLFDRTAWTYVWGPNVQHSSYFSANDFQRDINWGKRSVNGLSVNATNLPGNYEVNFVYGKTPFNLSSVIDNVGAVKISKSYRLQKFGLIALNSNGQSSNTNGEPYGNSTLGATYETNLNEWIISAEANAGQFYAPNVKTTTDIGLITNIRPSKRALGFPLNIEAYYIGADFANIHSSIINTSVEEAQFSFNGDNVPDGARPFGGTMTPFHLKSNNRTGLNLSTEFNFGPININLANGISTDLEARNNTISYYHKVNGLFLARTQRFSPNAGAYGAVKTFFRGAYETATVIDTSSLNTIAYNVGLINLKFKNKLLGRNFFLFYLGDFQSSQDNLSPVPVFSNKAYIRAQFHEFDLYYNFAKKLSLVGYIGFERIRGNEKTDLGENGLARKQNGQVLGAGLDIVISPKSSIYVRSKWVQFEDKNFLLDHYSGLENSVEFKVIF